MGLDEAHLQVREALAQAAVQAIPQRTQVLHPAGELPAGQLCRGAQPHHRGHVLGPGAHAALVGRAQQQGLQRRAPSDVEGADALGGVELVPCHREEIHAELLHVHRDLAHRLRRIGVQHSAAGAAGRGDVGHRLQGAGLVVGQHQRHQRGGALE